MNLSLWKKLLASRLIASLIILIGLIGVSWVNLSHAKGDKSNAAYNYDVSSISSKQKQKPYLIEAAIAKYEKVPEVLTAVGHLTAYRNVDLSFNTAGMLKKIYYKNGARVEQGKLIATLDDQLDQVNLASAQAKLIYSKSMYESNLELSKKMAIAKVTLLQKKSAWLQDQANVKLNQSTLDLKKLYAPFSGYLAEFQVNEGSYVAAGTKLVALRQISPVQVNYSLPSVDQSKVEIAQQVNISTSALPNKIFKGLVSYRAQYVDPDTGTFDIQATIKNPDFILLPGMFVQVEQIINPKRKLLVVPNIAVQTDIEGEFVYVIKKTSQVDGKSYGVVHKRKVASVLIGKNITSINSGLKTGEWIVSAGQQQLNPGDYVIISNSQDLLKISKNKQSYKSQTTHKKQQFPAQENNHTKQQLKPNMFF